MYFRRVHYLEWAKAHIDNPRVPYSLARSSVDHLTARDLGLDLDGLGFTCPTAFGVPELVDALCARYAITPDRLLVTAGVTMANFLLCAALLKPGDRVVVERPVYETLWRNVQALGARIAWLKRDWDVDVGRLDRMLSREKTRLVVLSNLHNPSGRHTPPDRVREIGRIAAKHGARVLWDEVYLDSLAPPTTPAALLHPRSSMSTLSLDKSYGLGGLKVGWCIAPPSVIRRAFQVADHIFPCNPPIMERIALRAVEKMNDLRARSVAVGARGKQIVEEWIAARKDLAWSNPDGGFIGFARFKDPKMTSRILEQRLQKLGGTLVAPGHHFGAPNGFRIGFGVADTSVIKHGLQALDRALKG